MPLIPNSPTEKHYLDNYTLNSEGEVENGDNYTAFIKTNLINASQPYDTEVHSI